jgi:hypothetical protein
MSELVISAKLVSTGLLGSGMVAYDAHFRLLGIVVFRSSLKLVCLEVQRVRQIWPASRYLRLAVTVLDEDGS